MVAEVLPNFDPTPSSVAEIARRLPAHERARVEWFPQALRTAFIEPLTHASRDEFHARLDEVTVAAVRTVLQLVANLGVLTEHEWLSRYATAFRYPTGAGRRDRGPGEPSSKQRDRSWRITSRSLARS